MVRRFVVLAMFFLAVCGSAIAADHSSTVTIMTQNMDDGTDQTFVVAAAMNLIPLTLAQAVDLTYAELQASRFEQRNALLAQKIAAAKPDLLALQEASLWRTGPSPDNATVPLVDQIALILAALNQAGV